MCGGGIEDQIVRVLEDLDGVWMWWWFKEVGNEQREKSGRKDLFVGCPQDMTKAPRDVTVYGLGIFAFSGSLRCRKAQRRVRTAIRCRKPFLDQGDRQLSGFSGLAQKKSNFKMW